MSSKFNYFAPKKQRNIPPNLPSTHLSIPKNYLSVLKTEE